MKVLLDDGMTINRVGGISRYTHLLSEALSQKNVDVQFMVKPAFPGPRPVRRLLYLTWLNTAFRNLIDSIGPDVVHFTNYLVPWSKKTTAKYVVTIHDMAVWKVPWSFSRSYVAYLRWAIRMALRKADAIVTVSEAVKEEIQELTGMGRDIYVIPNMLAPVFSTDHFPKPSMEDLINIRRRFGIPCEARVVLYVGALERRKNIATLIKAVIRLREALSHTDNIFLLLAGKPGFGFDEIAGLLANFGSTESWKIVEGVSDEDLRLIYDMSDIFVLPSFYEGFGLPILEAWARGLPVVLSDIPVFREVAGDAARYFIPDDYETLADLLGELLGDTVDLSSLRRKGALRLQRFTLDQVGQKLIDLYRAIA